MRITRLLCLALVLGLLSAPLTTWAQDHQGEDDHGDSSSRFSDEPIPLADLPDRPRPIIELGETFLGTGTLNQGFRLPTGAVWQPAFLAWGNVRSAVQGFDNQISSQSLGEAAARFDLFGNLYLTQTERILIGFRPLDQGGQFTRYTFSSENVMVPGEEDFEEELNFGIRTLFFEGDFSEIFPKLDWRDSRGLDYYFSVGRQPLSFQDGLLINEDAIDMIGLTRANMKFFGSINSRVTGVFGWNDIDRSIGSAQNGFTNAGDNNALLFALYSETDIRKRTIEIDAIVVLSDEATNNQFGRSLATGGNGVYLGFGSTRRIGHYNNTFRVVGSLPAGTETTSNSSGVLALNQVGWTPYHSYNWVYINTFASFGSYRSAARGPATGGALGATGLLFSAVGIGRFGAALNNRAEDSVGGSVGYQMFFAKTRRQLIVEVGGRVNYDEPNMPGMSSAGGIARYQIAVKRRGVIVIDGFSLYDFGASDLAFGGRLELVLKL